MKNRAGMERILTAKINYLAEHTNYQLYLLTYEQEGSPLPFSIAQSVQHISIDHIIPLRKDYSISVWFIKFLATRKHFHKSFIKQIEDIKPDIVICNPYSFSVIDLIITVSTSKGIKTIIESHTKLSSTLLSNKFKYNKALYSLIKKWDELIMNRLRPVSNVVTLTKQDAKDWEPFVNNITVIPNFITITPKNVKSYSAKRVISAGRYAHEKGYDMLLKAWAIVTEVYPDWELHIFGDGDSTPYAKMSQQLRISDSVFLHPSTSDISEEFSNSSIYVMSSRYEGFGLVLAEAMSCGLASVAFDCPYGPRTIIEDRHDGLLVQREDIKQLSDGLLFLMSDPMIRITFGSNASEDIKRFNKESIMQKWIDLINTTVINNNRI